VSVSTSAKKFSASTNSSKVIVSLVFFGSSDFSLYALRACLDSGQKIALVVTTSPQKKGRGLQESPTPVQAFAQSKQISFIAPANLKDPQLLESTRQLHPDYFVVSSYGKMIPSLWLKIPRRYAINVHPSLLPKYRGAAPINWPIILGDRETGVSLAEVTPELDAGDLFFQKRYPLPTDTDAVQMTAKLGGYSYDALKEIFAALNQGELKRTPQDHSSFNYARKLNRGDGKVNWNRTAESLHNQIRGLLPWPIASFHCGEPVQILKSSITSDAGTASPGTITGINNQALLVQTAKGILSLDRVKPAGRKEMSGGDFARGKRLAAGAVLESDNTAPNFVLTQSYK
jgi:methionyl-tRNA formyltransferase